MATSKDTFYFSHDYNARTDEKIKRLIRKHGMAGYGIFWAIVEDLYNNANALQADYEGIAFDLHTSPDTVESIVNDFDLFVFDGDVFGSLSVERRLNERNEKSISAQKAAHIRWEKAKLYADAMRLHSDSNAIKERKGKEKKEIEEESTAPIHKLKKQPKQPDFNFLSELLSIGVTEQVANDWMAVRKSKGATNTKTAFERIVKQIEKSGLTADECISIAVERSWQGFNAEWVHEKPTRLPPPNINTSYERWDAESQTRYFGKQVIPYDAPPRPSNLEKWDDNKKQWIFSMN
jgi:hypothetical protein